MSQIIAIANQKGGVGKTTTTINLGAYLAKAGRRVLLIDLDPQANSSSGLGLNKNKLDWSLYDVLVDGRPVDKIIHRTSFDKLFILPASPVLAAAEVELSQIKGREFLLKKALAEVIDQFDIVLIDCPPSLGLLTINGLAAANQLLIPVQSEYFALEGLTQLLATVSRVRQGLNPNLHLLGLVITMHASRTSLAAQVENELRHHFPDQVFNVTIPRNIRLAEAPSHGKPISHYDRFSKGAASYKKLAKEVINRVDRKK